MGKTELLFLGTSTCRFDTGNDTSSCLLNGRLLIDTGWSAVQNLRDFGVDPANVRHVLFTHMHHDHYLSLPSFLFYHLCVNTPLKEITLIGPSEDLERVVKSAMNFLQVEAFYPHQSWPMLVPLSPGDRIEACGLEITSSAAIHPVQALCYRIRDPQGATVGISGDTCYTSDLGRFFAGCGALVHECSLGPTIEDPEANARMLHSSADDAGRVAREACVGQLILTHGSTRLRNKCIAAAQQQYSQLITWPERGETYHL